MAKQQQLAKSASDSSAAAGELKQTSKEVTSSDAADASAATSASAAAEAVNVVSANGLCDSSCSEAPASADTVTASAGGSGASDEEHEYAQVIRLVPDAPPDAAAAAAAAGVGDIRSKSSPMTVRAFASLL